MLHMHLTYRRGGGAFRSQPATTGRVLIRDLVQTVILALLIFLAFRFAIQNYRVEGPSMEPTVSGGQHLLVNRLVYLRFDPAHLPDFLPFVNGETDGSVFAFHPPRRGEVVVFRFPEEDRDFVKRVVGLPGDTVEIRNGEVFVNGAALDEPYITDPGSSDMQRITVGEGSYFVLGDNRRRSDDSRPRGTGQWRPVPADSIVGRAWLRYWPLAEWGVLDNSVP